MKHERTPGDDLEIVLADYAEDHELLMEAIESVGAMREPGESIVFCRSVDGQHGRGMLRVHLNDDGELVDAFMLYPQENC